MATCIYDPDTQLPWRHVTDVGGRQRELLIVKQGIFERVPLLEGNPERSAKLIQQLVFHLTLDELATNPKEVRP